MPRQNNRRRDDEPRRGKARPQKVALHHARAEAGGGEGGGREVYVGPGEELRDVELEPGQTVTVDRGALIGVTVRRVPDGEVGIYVKDPRGARVEWCHIDGCAGRGIAVSAAEGFDDARPVIRGNLLENWTGREKENVHEGLQLGMTASHTKTRLGALCELNYLRDVGVEAEAISVKSSGNTVRHNALEDCGIGKFTNRHGQDNQYLANTGPARFLGGPGVISDHEGEVIFMKGTTTQEGLEKVRKSKGKKPYPAAQGWRFARLSHKPRIDDKGRNVDCKDNQEDDALPVVERRTLTAEDVGPNGRLRAEFA